MGRNVSALALSLLLASAAPAQEAPVFQDSLLDHMAGKWVLQGTIAGSKTTHDVNVAWILGHQYLQLHEVSREKNAQHQPAYEAIVFIGWDAPSSQYACLWLDNTGGGGLNGQAIAHARRGSDSLAFLFKGSDGSLFHTTFVYSRASDTWQWFMDGEEGGKLQPFARVTLRREE